MRHILELYRILEYDATTDSYYFICSTADYFHLHKVLTDNGYLYNQSYLGAKNNTHYIEHRINSVNGKIDFVHLCHIISLDADKYRYYQRNPDALDLAIKGYTTQLKIAGYIFLTGMEEDSEGNCYRKPHTQESILKLILPELQHRGIKFTQGALWVCHGTDTATVSIARLCDILGVDSQIRASYQSRKQIAIRKQFESLRPLLHLNEDCTQLFCALHFSGHFKIILNYLAELSYKVEVDHVKEEKLDYILVRIENTDGSTISINDLYHALGIPTSSVSIKSISDNAYHETCISDTLHLLSQYERAKQLIPKQTPTVAERTELLTMHFDAFRTSFRSLHLGQKNARCPITNEVMTNPIFSVLDNQSYEKNNYIAYCQANGHTPKHHQVAKNIEAISQTYTEDHLLNATLYR